MADVFSRKKRSQVMSAIRSDGNKDTELKLAAIFRKSGIRGWLRYQQLPGRPDFLFRRERLAVFVDGCFWHGCPQHGRNPQSNREYWINKLQRNRMRDRLVTHELRRCGWQILRLWEHALRVPEQVASRCHLALMRAAVRKAKRLSKQGANRL